MKPHLHVIIERHKYSIAPVYTLLQILQYYDVMCTICCNIHRNGVMLSLMFLLHLACHTAAELSCHCSRYVRVFHCDSACIQFYAIHIITWNIAKNDRRQ